jgi:hypothetical protein
LSARAAKTSSVKGDDDTASGGAVSVLPKAKNFSTDAPAKALRLSGFDQKRANRAQTDSEFVARTMRSAHRDEADANIISKIFGAPHM